MQRKRTPEGVRPRHSRACRSGAGGTCNCSPSWEAWAFSARDGKKIRKTFHTLAEAKSWRHDACRALTRGELRQPAKVTLREAAEAWLEGAKSGTVRNRSGDPYKPSAIRGYEAALNHRVLSQLGAHRISDIRRLDLQDFADRLLAEGLDPSTVRNALMPLRAIYRRAISRGDVSVNPTTGLELPAVRGKRDRVADPAEAAKLLAAVPDGDRALWATAFYAGLRLGELRALGWEHVDLAAGVMRVERSWDPKEGFVAPKSLKGTRSVPIASVLREHLIQHKLRSGRSEGLAFGRSATPFNPASVYRRANAAWDVAGLRRIGLHDCRHTYVTLMHDAGLSLERIGDYVGHSSTYMTDRYRHLLAGHEQQAAQMLDAYLAAPALSD